MHHTSSETREPVVKSPPTGQSGNLAEVLWVQSGQPPAAERVRLLGVSAGGVTMALRVWAPLACGGFVC